MKLPDIESKYPTKLDKDKLSNTEWIKQRTLELYSYLPQTSLEDRAKYTDIRDEVIFLNYNFFKYIANTKYIVNSSISNEDKVQSAILHFCEHWTKFMFTPKYRNDLSFTSFFTLRIKECIQRECSDIKQSMRRPLLMKIGSQINKYWSDVTYEDLKNVTLSPQQMKQAESIFQANNNVDLSTVSLYRPANNVEYDGIEELYSDEYDSLEDLIIHEMIEQESKLDDSYLLKMANLYTIPFEDLLKARPNAEEKLKAKLTNSIYISENFRNYNEDVYYGSENDMMEG